MAEPADAEGKRRGRGPASAKFERRPPSEAEQARRKEWGDRYGAIMADIKRQHAGGHR